MQAVRDYDLRTAILYYLMSSEIAPRCKYDRRFVWSRTSRTGDDDW